jgi:hypothetical protein
MTGSFPTANYIPGFRAGADLSASTNRYKALFLATDGDVELATANEMEFIGFLQNCPASGSPAEIAGMGGGSKAIAGGTIDAGNLLTTDGNGDLVAITTGQTKAAVARALEGAVDNDVFAVLVLSGATHTAP